MPRGDRKKIIDVDLQLKDAYLVAASAAAQVSSTNKILTIGSGLVKGIVRVDVSAIEIASNDELYKIVLQGSTSATFASAIEILATLVLGAKEVKATGGGTGADVDSTTGVYLFPFMNSLDGGDTIYPYVRLYTMVSGSIATGGGINYDAYLTKD